MPRRHGSNRRRVNADRNTPRNRRLRRVHALIGERDRQRHARKHWAHHDDDAGTLAVPPASQRSGS